MRQVVVEAVMILVVGAARRPRAWAAHSTFEDRVAAQKAIEQVYWNHRILAGGKPAAEAVDGGGADR